MHSICYNNNKKGILLILHCCCLENNRKNSIYPSAYGETVFRYILFNMCIKFCCDSGFEFFTQQQLNCVFFYFYMQNESAHYLVEELTGGPRGHWFKISIITELYSLQVPYALHCSRCTSLCKEKSSEIKNEKASKIE